MPELMTVEDIGKEILAELELFNKKIWGAVSFRLIHATMNDKDELKNSYANVQSYRKQRFQKALIHSNGDKRKAYELLASEDFI